MDRRLTMKELAESVIKEFGEDGTPRTAMRKDRNLSDMRL